MSITTGSKVIIHKGCKARGITKGAIAKVINVTELGAEYSHSVKVTLYFFTSFSAGKTFSFYARHINRLSGPHVNLNDGNPNHKIVIQLRPSTL